MKNFEFSEFDPTQYENKDRFEQNSEMQQLLVKQVLKFLPDDDSKPANLDYFFYTNSIEKAEELCKQLQKLDYQAEVRRSFDNQWSVTGYTLAMEINDEAIENWVKDMCELSYKNGCRFDGWGMLMDL